MAFGSMSGYSFWCFGHFLKNIDEIDQQRNGIYLMDSVFRILATNGDNDRRDRQICIYLKYNYCKNGQQNSDPKEREENGKKIETEKNPTKQRATRVKRRIDPLLYMESQPTLQS